jgi:hypothetical protein
VNDLVTIIVQEDDTSKSFSLPKKLLVWHSSYFAAALDPEGWFAPSGSDKLQIDDDIGVFEAFSCWMYTGRLRDPPTLKMITDEGDEELGARYLAPLKLCQIWVFGDARGVPALKNAAIDMLHECLTVIWHTGPFKPTIKYIYRNTTDRSHLRKFLIDMHAWTRSFECFSKINRTVFTIDFVMEVMPIFIQRAQTGEPKIFTQKSWTKVDRCQWHDHSGPGGKLRLENRE